MKNNRKKLFQVRKKEANYSTAKVSTDFLSVKIYGHSHKQNFVEIAIPNPCNMKILKIILQFNAKKISSTQFQGFQTFDKNYEIDFKLHKGIGQLTQDTTFVPLIKKQTIKRSILNYQFCRYISSGGFSKVYLFRNLIDGQFYAGKCISKRIGLSQQLVMSQYWIGSALNHPNIVKTYDFYQTQHFYIFMMEYCPGGQFFELLKENRFLGQANARFYFFEILLGLKSIHEKGIVFRDLKPENIFMNEEGYPKIGDFGLAKQIKQKSFSFCGSLEYMAPEMLSKKGHSFEIDFYCLGNLLHEILMGSPPYYDPTKSEEQIKDLIMYSHVELPSEMNLSAEVQSLIFGLLEKDPSERLGSIGGIDEIMNHPWLSDISSQKLQKNRIKPPVCIECKIMTKIQASQLYEINQFQKQLKNDLRKLKIKQLTQKRCNNRNSCGFFSNSRKGSISKQQLSSKQKKNFIRNHSLSIKQQKQKVRQKSVINTIKGFYLSNQHSRSNNFLNKHKRLKSQGKKIKEDAKKNNLKKKKIESKIKFR